MTHAKNIRDPDYIGFQIHYQEVTSRQIGRLTHRFEASRSPSETRTSNESTGTGLILNTFHFISAAGLTFGASVDNLTNHPGVPLRLQVEQQELPSGTINKKASGPQNYRSRTRYCRSRVWHQRAFLISVHPNQTSPTPCRGLRGPINGRPVNLSILQTY